MTNQPTSLSDVPFELVADGEELPDHVFCDGFNGILVSPALTKLTFYTVVGLNQETQHERRKNTLLMSIPTAQLIELCQKVLFYVAQQQDRLGEALDVQKSVIASLPRTE